MHEGAGTLSWRSCQSWRLYLPVAHSCGFLNHLNSFWRGMFKLNTKFNADSLLYPLSHFECDSHTVHMLTQQCLPPPLTSTMMSSCFTHAHSRPPPWLPGYIDVMQTILVILTMAGLFPGKQVNVCVYVCVLMLLDLCTSSETGNWPVTIAASSFLPNYKFLILKL